MPNVFVSYGRNDGDWARQFADALKAQDVGVWIDKWMPAGDEWVESIEPSLRESDALVVILSTQDALNPYISFEIGAALAGRKRLIPILSEDFSNGFVPLGLRNHRYLTKGSPEVAAHEVASALKQPAAA
jgi:hypothetical protein